MKKKTDYIEDEMGMAYDDGMEEELKKDRENQIKKKELEEMEAAARAEAEALDAAIAERRMANWERASVLTQEMAQRAMKAMATECKLRIAQLLALVAIALILLAK